MRLIPASAGSRTLTQQEVCVIRLFNDYDAITLSDLKDDANSLLNLVTEELRPLRVIMENGKEFLLFPQELLDPIYDNNFRMILLAAMRYAMGRNTFMPLSLSLKPRWVLAAGLFS